jgi:cell division protein FtsB
MSPTQKRSAPPFLRKRVQRTGRIDRLWRLLGIGAICLALYALVLGDSGWLALSRQRAEVESLERDVESLRAAEARIREQLSELQKPSSFELERVARDEFGLVREGERVLHVVEAAPAP